MKIKMINLVILGIIFVSGVIFTSSIYHFLNNPIAILYIPTPDGRNITLNITGSDLFKILSSAVNHINVNITKKSELLEKYIEEINKIIEENKEAYLFYYDEFQRIYPERYFILCIQDGCGYYYFTVAGLIEASPEEKRIAKPLVILFDEKSLETLLYLLKNHNNSVIDKFKEYLMEGKIKVRNFETIAERIAKRYGVH